MLAELLDCAKKDILAHVQESIDQIYADFECVKPETRGAQSQINLVAQWHQNLQFYKPKTFRLLRRQHECKPWATKEKSEQEGKKSKHRVTAHNGGL